MSVKQFTQKQKLTILNSAKKIGIKKAAKIADIHWSTIYNWRKSLNALGKNGFLKYQHQGHGRGTKKITVEQESAICDTWNQNKEMGPGQVRNQLRRQGITISTRTVRRIMQANGYNVPVKKRQEAHHRFEARYPLELAQMDILEFFINKLKVYLIILLDDFSRFILGWRLLTKTSVDDVIGIVQTAIDRYGKMQEILTDRGFVFYSWRGINRFERYLQNEGIDHTHASAHHPQTLGKVEACNRRIKNELFTRRHFSSTTKAETAIDSYVNHYNYHRTHQGIGGLLVPGERFHGQADIILAAINKKMAVSSLSESASDIDRSIFNLVCGPEGQLTFYIMGQPIQLSGGIPHVKRINPGRSGHNDTGSSSP